MRRSGQANAVVPSDASADCALRHVGDQRGGAGRDLVQLPRRHLLEDASANRAWTGRYAAQLIEQPGPACRHGRAASTSSGVNRCTHRNTVT